MKRFAIYNGIREWMMELLALFRGMSGVKLQGKERWRWELLVSLAWGVHSSNYEAAVQTPPTLSKCFLYNITVNTSSGENCYM